MYRTRPLWGQLITTGPGDYDPPDEGCPGCDDLYAKADRLREQLAEVRAQVDDLLVLHDEVEAERDRLARVLAVERGDQTAAPDGWRWVGTWSRYDVIADTGAAVTLSTSGAQRWWSWDCSGPGGRASGRESTALEAMEAADAALVGVSSC
jgi:hypothetical protein